MNISNLFKYKKTINFGKYNNGDETFFTRCVHSITKFRFKIHQTNEYIVSDLPILTTYFPQKGYYDVTCVSEREKDCEHNQKNISTYKIYVSNTDIVIVNISLNILRYCIIIGLIWLTILGFNTLI